MKQFFLNLISGTIEGAGESKLEELLQQLHDKHPDQYKAAVFGGIALANAVKPLAEKSPNKIDDAFVSALNDACRDSAAANGLDVSEA